MKTTTAHIVREYGPYDNRPGVHGVSFDIGPRETVALVGESGSGKSVSALSVLCLLPRDASRIGGSVRWESKAAIGFYGKVGDPVNTPTVINLNDVTRPVYDKGNTYSDIWISYSRRIWDNRIGWKIQLNVNNWTESGRLMPTQVNFDGTPWAYRIIDPRQFILTSTFTF